MLPAAAGIEQWGAEQGLAERANLLGMAHDYSGRAGDFALGAMDRNLARQGQLFGQDLSRQTFEAAQNAAKYQSDMVPWHAGAEAASQPAPWVQPFMNMLGSTIEGGATLGAAGILK
jgi:hypothetical protein